MTTTIRETERFELFKDIHGNTAICDKYTGRQSNWNTGSVEVRDEINHIKHLDNDGFDDYCEMMTSIN